MDLIRLQIITTTKDFVEALPINGKKLAENVEYVVMHGFNILAHMKHPVENMQLGPLLKRTLLKKQSKSLFK